MKKLFTLLTLALFAVSGAWATNTTLIDGYTLPDLPTSTCNVTSLSYDEDGYIVYCPFQTTLRSTKPAWYSENSGGSSSNTWSASGIFPATPSGDGNKCSSVQKTNKNYAVRFTGASDVLIYAKGNSSSRSVTLDVYEVIAGVIQTPRVNSASCFNSATILTVDGLNTAKEYVAFIYASSDNNGNLYGLAFKTPVKTVDTQTFAGVKKGSTELTQGTDYTVSSTTITLAEAYKSVSAPTDVKLINHITYTDETDAYQDVEVTLVKNGDYFEGSEFIGLTEYTVKVPVDVTPTLEADKASLTITSTKAAKATATIQLTGANLTGDASVAFASAVDGLTISPATITLTDGAVNQTFTVTYQSFDDVAENTVNLTFTVGSKSVEIPVTYSSTAAIKTITDVSTAKEWDFSKAGSANIESPANGTLIPFANVDGFASGFDYESLAGNAQYFYYHSNNAFQGIELMFHTTVDGYITVDFSNTGGGDRPYRHLYVNGEDTGKKSNNTTKITAENIHVDAGDVSLKGMMENGEDPLTPNMLRIYKVVFTPATFPVTLSCAGGLATYYNETYDLDFSTSGAKAYVVTDISASSVTLEEVTKVPAGYGVIVKGENQGDVVNVSVAKLTSEEITEFENLGNKLYAGPWTVSSDGEYWALSKTDGKFHPLKAGVTIPAGKAYLPGSEVPTGANFLSLDFGEGEGDVTGIEAVKSHKVVNNNVFYNLAGQQVAQPAKGLYIVNGKKVIIK